MYIMRTYFNWSLLCVLISLLFAVQNGLFGIMVNEFSNNYYRLVLDPATGEIKSLTAHGQEFIHQVEQPRDLFKIRLRDEEGKAVDLSSAHASRIHFFRDEYEEGVKISIHFLEIDKRPFDAVVSVLCDKNTPFSFWTIRVRNETGLWLEHIDFPVVIVSNELPSNGGDARLFWPCFEGVLVENLNLREKTWFRWQPIEHPAMGWIGLYPGPVQMQFMAYYTPKAGLYFAAHDERCTPKGIEFHPHPQGGIYLDYRLFPGPVYGTEYELPFPMVLGVFQGDWYDAAEIYRKWWESSPMHKPPKLEVNPSVPSWLYESPVVIMYPIRGQKDLGIEMSPNPEYYPYTNALPIIKKYNDQLQSPLLVLLMHWEGTAPWAPPYVWPPYGDLDDFCRFRDELHKDGNKMGLYGSGVAYTIRSNTDPSYDMSREFEEKKIIRYVTYAPDGKPAENGVCAGPHAQRIGYDLCPANEWVKQVVVEEIKKIVPYKIDYLQYFDQNLGGACYRCYARFHGHPPGPGLWQTEVMRDLYRRIVEIIQSNKVEMLVGCEANASEPFIPYLLLNDSRSYLGLSAGTPVPAYAYVFHEYLNNFMGNQNASSYLIDEERCPYNLHQRIAISFIQGDLLTLNLRAEGKVAWEWSSAPWDRGPDQEQIVTFVRNLNLWRRGIGKNFLFFGRMKKPLRFEGDKDVPIVTPRNDIIHFKSILTSRWSYKEKESQFFVNYLPESQIVKVYIPKEIKERVKLFTNPLGYESEGKSVGSELTDSGVISIEIPPLSAIMLMWQ